MSLLAWLVAATVTLLTLVVLAAVRSASRRSEAQLAAVRQEMQNSLAAQSHAVTTQMGQQINHLAQAVTQQLGQVRQELQSGVASTAKLTADAQRDVSQRLQSSVEAVLQMNRKIGELQQWGQDLSKATDTLQSVLGGAKTRGMLGEAALDRLLADALPQDAYSTQFRFATGAVVDAVLHSGERLLPIDSKFPLEAYRRMLDAGPDPGAGTGGGTGDGARRDFSTAVRKHADSIAEKYILPDEHTLAYALMFVPSEGVYYEMLMTSDAKHGPLDEYCRNKRVFPVSPNTLYAFLSAICVTMQGQRLEENARHLFAGLAGLRKHIESFADVYERLGTHLRHAQQSYEDADSRFTKARNALEQIAEGALPEALPAESPKTLFETAPNE
jgi:DNA recombination protein RmuC